MVRSRISRIEEKQTKKRFALTIIGIVVILVLVISLGIPLLVKISILLGNLNSKKTIDSGDTTAPFPPTLVSVVDATNSAILKLEGYGESESSVKLFVNEEEIDTVATSLDGTFIFNGIRLKPGINTLYATITDRAGNESTSSSEIRVTYKKEAPKLEISQPQENQTFGKNQQEITIKGTTEQQVNLWINDRFVSVLDDGSFTYTQKLNDGENTLMIVARDLAGNETKVERKVIYSP